MNIRNCKLSVLFFALIAGGIMVAAAPVVAQDKSTANGAVIGMADGDAVATATLPLLWSAGGLSAGTDGAGQSARTASDIAGNIAVVSGPANGRNLAVTSYTVTGTLRWRRTISPSSGTFVGDWVVAASNGDLIAIGHNQDSQGRPIQSTMVRYDTNGTLLWRVDFSSGFYPVVGRLVVDSAGAAYVTWSATGSGIFVQKYSVSGALVWSRMSLTGGIYGVATSLALSPDETDVVATGDISGGATWITAAFDTATGIPKWEVAAPEGVANLDVVVDATRVYVTGQGNVGISAFLSVVAYDRATGARLWRTDKKPVDGSSAAGLRMAMAPDGSIVVTGQANRGFLDWYTVSFEATGAVRWEAVRDGGLNTDEIPRGLLVLPDGTSVMTGPGGPSLPGGFIQGVTAGYSRSGTLLWEGFSRLATVWATALPGGDVCATGGYDALVTCFDVPGGITPIEPVAIIAANPTSGTSPLSVSFDGSASNGPNPLVTWAWTFGDGGAGSGVQIQHTYTTPGSYTASLVVADILGLTSLPRTVTITVNAAPLPWVPSNLTATALSKSSVALAWTNGPTRATQVRIERCQGLTCTDFVEIAVVPGNSTTFTNSRLTANTSYRYRVRASNSFGNSAYSNIAGVRTSKR